MKKIAFIFPGQGSQAAGMGLDFYNNFECVKNLYNKADTILGKQISKLCFEGPDEELKKTINAQSAIVTTSLAAFSAFKEKCPNIIPAFALGHSLGEYCAMYVSGAMNFETTLRAIQKRSELMDNATKDAEGSMAAILGSTIEVIEECMEEARSLGSVQIANYNDPTQVVITGEAKAVERASALIKNKNAKRVVPLAVSGAFHSKLMKSARDGFVDFVKTLDIKNSKIPVITNVDAQITTEAEDFREKMPEQIQSSVMWVQSIRNAIREGVDTFIEFGNGKVLAGLNRKISPEITTYNVSDTQTLDAALSELMVGV